MKDKSSIVFISIGAIVIIWLSLLIAPYLSDGIVLLIEKLPEQLKQPFNIEFCNDSLKAIFIFLSLYVLLIGIYTSTRKKYRRGKEYGSAVWGIANQINKKYKQIPNTQNKILTQNVKMGLKAPKHKRNLNTLVCGGSGAGKTRFFVKPNIMQCNCSFVVLDPKGEILRDTGYLLEKQGYKVKVLDLVTPRLSHCYNPFKYIQDDNDVQKLVSNLFKSTTPKGSNSSDPFWDIAAQMLLSALIFYLKYEAPEEEQNFAIVGEMLRAGNPKEDDEDYESPLDILFKRLEFRNPDHIAVKYYKDYHSGAGKTLKSIQVTLASKLEKFNIDEIASLTMTDELELDKLGEEKICVFAVIPDSNTSYNFLVSILYTQIFQNAFYRADNKYKGALPIPIHFLMDEFANVALPDDFDKILSVMRSRNVFVSIILQNLSQLKALFEKQWESIVGNCDEFLYLGGNEQSTHKYVAELLGKETIDINTHGKSSGRNGNYSTNYQQLGRELLTADEVRMLPNEKAILLIRGEKPIIDLKYDILKHPNIKYTVDGKAPIYEHGVANQATGIIEQLKFEDLKNIKDIKELEDMSYELLSEEDIENYINMEEYENERKQENNK